MTSAVVRMYLLCVLVCVVYACTGLPDQPQGEGTFPVQIKTCLSSRPSRREGGSGRETTRGTWYRVGLRGGASKISQ